MRRQDGGARSRGSAGRGWPAHAGRTRQSLRDQRHHAGIVRTRRQFGEDHLAALDEKFDAEQSVAAEIVDDGAGERRRRSFEAIEERARTINGRLSIGAGMNGGTSVRVVLPVYAAAGDE